MNKEQDYSSNSDESDEDFCPDVESESDVEESDYKGSDSEIEENDVKKSSKKKRKSNKSKYKIKEMENDSVEEKKISDPVNEEEEKKRSDDLWASFLSDVNGTTESTSICDTVSKKPQQDIKKKSNNEVELKKQNEVQNDNNLKKIKVTEILEFAGEEIEVTKEVVADTKTEEKKIPINVNKPINNIVNKFSKVPSLKRPTAGGLSSVLGQIGKKTKLSVLEKTKLDWDGFKKKEGLNEELQTFNKGKDGYLERQDFLQRTDVRQFEIEKSLRQTKRKF